MNPAERAISAALVHLAAARDLLKVAKSPRSLAKVRAAITSAQGDERHARGMATRAESNHAVQVALDTTAAWRS